MCITPVQTLLGFLAIFCWGNCLPDDMESVIGLYYCLLAAVVAVLVMFFDGMEHNEYINLMKGYLGVEENECEEIEIKVYDVVYHLDDKVDSTRSLEERNQIADARYWRKSGVKREDVLAVLASDIDKENPTLCSIKKWLFLTNSQSGLGLADHVASFKIAVTFEPKRKVPKEDKKDKKSMKDL